MYCLFQGIRFPSVVRVSLFVSPVSPPTLVAKLRSYPLSTSTLAEEPVNTREPEVDASPATSRAARGLACFIPTLPHYL